MSVKYHGPRLIANHNGYSIIHYYFYFCTITMVISGFACSYNAAHVGIVKCV